MLFLMDLDAIIVADEITEHLERNEHLFALCLQDGSGKLETQGICINMSPNIKDASVCRVANLAGAKEIERPPSLYLEKLKNFKIHGFQLYPYETSSTVKVKTELPKVLAEFLF